MNIKTLNATLPVLCLTLIFSAASNAYNDKADSQNDCQRRYVFSWNMDGDCHPSPRGGSTTGAPLTLDTAPSKEWQSLQADGLSAFERDRRAILAMQGGYRTSFEFLETIGFDAEYRLARPYNSWGTEYVYIAEDRGDFISLQHIMVMFFEDEEGKIQGPMVMKHWRQDWQFEAKSVLTFNGDQTFGLQPLDKQASQGRWAQTVYQVDDSPRYGGVGRWQHNASFSAWTSEPTWRPLPRREHTVRDDYNVLVSTNRQVILPTGWVHEQDSLKLVSKANTADRYIANELGNNRYQRVKDFDFSAGDEYWQATAVYWKAVRDYWQQLAAQQPSFKVAKRVGDQLMFAVLFQQAEDYASGKLVSSEQDLKAKISETLKLYVSD